MDFAGYTQLLTINIAVPVSVLLSNIFALFHVLRSRDFRDRTYDDIVDCRIINFANLLLTVNMIGFETKSSLTNFLKRSSALKIPPLNKEAKGFDCHN